MIEILAYRSSLYCTILLIIDGTFLLNDDPLERFPLHQNIVTCTQPCATGADINPDHPETLKSPQPRYPRLQRRREISRASRRRDQISVVYSFGLTGANDKPGT